MIKEVTLCDFSIREVGNPNKSHKYTVQCVLPINLFNQQIFTGIWFWYLIVLFWNIVEMGVWIRRCLPSKSRQWIKRRISLISKSILIRKKRLDHFIETYLEPDGIFMIRMIANNTSDFVATDLVHHLWCQHADNYDQCFQDDPHNVDDSFCQFEHKKKDKPKHNVRIDDNVQNLENNRDYFSFPHVMAQPNEQEMDRINNLNTLQNLMNQLSYNRSASERNQSLINNDNIESMNLLEPDTLQIRKRDTNNSTKV